MNRQSVWPARVVCGKYPMDELQLVAFVGRERTYLIEKPGFAHGTGCKMKHWITIVMALVALFFAAQEARGREAQTPPNSQSFQQPFSAGQLDTNIFNTNGLVLPEDVQLLVQDLRVNISQAAQLLAILNGENPAVGPDAENPANPTTVSGASSQSVPNSGRSFAQNLGHNLGQNFGAVPGSPPAPPPAAPTALAPPSTPGTSGTNGAALVYALGAALEDMQADLQELLPRLALLAGQTNYPNSATPTRGSTEQPAGATGTTSPPLPPPTPRRAP